MIYNMFVKLTTESYDQYFPTIKIRIKYYWVTPFVYVIKKANTL